MENPSACIQKPLNLKSFEQCLVNKKYVAYFKLNFSGFQFVCV